MFHPTNLCIMGPSDKWITSIMSMFATKSIDLDMKALDQRHTYPLHCLPKSTNHFQYRKWRNRLQKVVEKQVLPIFPVQYTSLLSQWVQQQSYKRSAPSYRFAPTERRTDEFFKGASNTPGTLISTLSFLMQFSNNNMVVLW